MQQVDGELAIHCQTSARGFSPPYLSRNARAGQLAVAGFNSQPIMRKKLFHLPFGADDWLAIDHVAAALPNPAGDSFNQIVFSQNHLKR